MIEALGWGALAGSSLLIGAVVAMWRAPGNRTLGLVMGFGAGVLLSAVSFELVEEAVAAEDRIVWTTVGLLVGAAVFTLGDVAIGRLGYGERKDIDGAAPEGEPMAIVLGALLDGIPESAVLGLTLLQTGEIGLSMLVAVFVSNLPEGLAATSGLRSGGWTSRGIVSLWSGIAVASAISAGLGYLLLDGAGGGTLAFMFAFAGGAILTMLATSMMPEAFEHAGRSVGFVTVLGFIVAFSINWVAG